MRRRLGKEPFAVPNMIQVRAEEPAKPAEPPYFLYLGRLLKTKGVYELLEAARKVKARVVLAGDGPERERLREMAGENVELVGFAVGRRKEELLRGAYALVLPSYHEGMPYALLEGMAWGIPAVATEVGGVPQLVRHGVEGLLVPPRDAEALAEAMGRLLEDRVLRYNLAEGALRRAREFSVERLWVEYARVYESLLG